MTVIASVDLSTAWGPVHLQGLRPTCLAFTASELNRDANNASAALSAEYIYRAAARKFASWKAGGGLFLQHVSEALVQQGQPAARACPYLSHEPLEAPPEVPVLDAEEQLYTASVQQFPGGSAAVEAELLKGKPVGLILKLTDTFLAPVQGRVAFSHMLLGTDMHHAVVATGLGKHSQTSESHFRIRNTWGTEWGDGGNAWLPFSYVNFHAVTAFKV